MSLSRSHEVSPNHYSSQAFAEVKTDAVTLWPTDNWPFLYMRAPDSRIPAAFLTILTQLGLLVLAVIGLLSLPA